MITITERPLRQINSLTSRWTAGHNPVVYKFERTDYTVTEIIPTPTLFGGSVRVQIPEIGLGFAVGGSVYLGGTIYKGIGVIADVQENVAMEVTTMWLTGFTGSVSDGAAKLNDLSRRNYRIEINIRESGSGKLLGVADFAPFTNGLGKIDLHRYLAPYLLLRNDFEYDIVNERDVNASVKFYITYQERWLDYDEAVVSDVAQPIFVTNSAKQIGDLYGQNMGEYVPSSPPEFPSKFLTRFIEPVYWEGYPFSLSFIHSELLPVELSKVEALLNVNKQQTGEQSELLDNDQKQSVNRLMLEGGYADSVRYVRLKIRSGNPLPESYVYPGYVEDGYTAKL